MKLPTSLVAVKKINSSMARSSFPAEEIEKAAHLITDVEGTINPIILRRTSLESYEVVDGHFEYYAAVRAREISPLKGEMIQSIILESGNESTLLEQVDLFRKGSGSKLVSNVNDGLEVRFANLEKVFKSQFEELRKDNRNLERSITEMTSKIQNSGLGEELIDAIAQKVSEAVRTSRSSSGSEKKSMDELKENPLDLNSVSKKDLMTVPGIGEKIAAHIIEERKNKGNFTDIEQLSDIFRKTNNKINQNPWRKWFVIQNISE